MSTINEMVVMRFEQAGLRVLRLDTAPASLERSLLHLISRWPRLVRAAWNAFVFRRRKNGAIYCSVSGGWGLIYDAVCLFVARLGGPGALVLHHHSFRYVERRFWPMALVVFVAGRGAAHVVLGDAMNEGLRRWYPGIQRTLVLSNAALLADHFHGDGQPRERLQYVGYISNLSTAKGLDDVIETARLCASRGLRVRFKVAGPFEDPNSAGQFCRRMQATGNIDYLGPLYGLDKGAFFEEIDVLLFPTRYRHEAEPLVVLEAMANARAVIAYGRGCIPSMVTQSCGVVIDTISDFAGIASAVLAHWEADPTNMWQRGMAAAARFKELRDQGSAALAIMLSLVQEYHRTR